MSEPPAGPAPFSRREAEATPLGAPEAIAACGGDAHAAVEALLVMINHLRVEIAERDDEITALAARVSRGYGRGLGERTLSRLDDKTPRKLAD
ncbi:hypothetical protein FZC33_11490 [Labrys sp. KNU-23]|uniref:hypothetical protein n=1 Tax=Labrys sp. KNU-23 TaxID=2789216 RepID=UPI0011ECD622|nr:hypothetical protein [Labrys sp. KNU-23]QEN86913.1 hypothetical protein FZC33_11490 [Labrys sp. KNU-23]